MLVPAAAASSSNAIENPDYPSTSAIGAFNFTDCIPLSRASRDAHI